MTVKRAGIWLLVSALFLKLTRAVLSGPLVAPDTERFLQLANALLATTDPPPVTSAWGAPAFYSFYAMLLALVSKATRDLPNALAVIVILQAVVSAWSIYLLYQALFRLSGRRHVIAAALATGFLLNPDILLWDLAATADCINLSLLVASLSLLTGRLDAAPGARSARHFTLLMLSFLALALCRPTNLVFLAVSLLFLLQEEDSSRFLRRAITSALVFALVISAASLLRYAQAGNQPLVERLSSLARAGVVIHDRPAYDVAPPIWHSASPAEKVAHLGRTFAKRLAYFWAPALQGYSRSHTAASLVLVGGAWLFGLLALFRIRKRSTLDLVDWYLLSLIAAYNVFHALTVIDYDMRYRIVVVPFVLALIARGFRSDPALAARV